jgi:hypothetical protein
MIVDVEEQATPPIGLTELRPSFPVSTQHIRFRVWDQNSWTTFHETSGFIVGAFCADLWRVVVQSPYSPETRDGQQAIKSSTNRHFRKTGGYSEWVSVSRSLLQALKYASDKEHPHIALSTYTTSSALD